MRFLKTLLLLAAFFMYGMVFITETTNPLGSQIANCMIGIWVAWVFLSFYRRRVEQKRRIKKEKKTLDGYAIAEREIESNNKDEILWKKAFVDADGDAGKQKALYMKYRAKKITNS